MIEKLQSFVRILLLLWFVAVALVVLIPSAMLMWSTEQPASTEVTKNSETKESSEGTKTTMNKTTEKSSGKSRLYDNYGLVVKDTLKPQLDSILKALITWAFVSAGMGVLNNFVLVRKGKDPQPLRFL